LKESFVIVIFGASGSGKTTLMEQLLASGGQYSIHKKATDRPARMYDDVEIECVNDFNSQNYDYVYQTYGHRYGITRKQIDHALKQNQHHFIICNDISTIKSIKRDYSSAAKIVFHYFDAPQEVLLDIQKRREIRDDEINLRLAKTEILYRHFVEEWRLFDGALTNYYNEKPIKLKSRMEDLLFGLVDNNSLQGIVQKLDPVIRKLENKNTLKSKGQTQKNYVFIIMPIRNADPENEDIHHVIKRSCEQFGILAERVDEIQYAGQISEKIQGCIELSEFVIADLTHERPNVYYEIGYADAHNKPLILIAKHGTKVHFDLQGMNIKYYKGMHHLETELNKFIEKIRHTSID